MPFFGLLVIVAVAFSAATLYTALQLSGPITSMQSQMREYSAVVSVEAFVVMMNETYPTSGNAIALSNWRTALYASARADRLNVSLANGYAVIRGPSDSNVYATVLLPEKT